MNYDLLALTRAVERERTLRLQIDALQYTILVWTKAAVVLGIVCVLLLSTTLLFLVTR